MNNVWVMFPLIKPGDQYDYKVDYGGISPNNLIPFVNYEMCILNQTEINWTFRSEPLK